VRCIISEDQPVKYFLITVRFQKNEAIAPHQAKD